MLRSYQIITGLAVLGAAACTHTEAHPTPPEGPPRAVRAAVVHEELLPSVHRASGTVRGRNTAVLTSKTIGYIRAVRVRAGDSVTAGQALVDLEANDVRASVARARAALDRSLQTKAEAENGLVAARADAKMAKSFYDRAVRLVKESAISEQQFDDAEARWRAAEAQEQMANARVRAVGSGIDEARAALGEATATLGYAAITAPFSGRVIERRVDPGVLAAPGTPLVVLSDEGSLRVEAALEESLADAVKVGDEAEIAIGSAPVALGKVGEIVPNVEVASRAFLVKIDLPATFGSLRPGTFARVGVRVGARPRLVVPTTAVTSLGALDRVFVVEGGRARLRMITRGESIGAWTEVLSGLSKDERIVESPPSDLRDSMPVEVKP